MGLLNIKDPYSTRLISTIKPRKNLTLKVYAVCILLLLSFSQILSAVPWDIICDRNNCDTYFRQGDESWEMVIVCEDGDWGIIQNQVPMVVSLHANIPRH